MRRWPSSRLRSPLRTEAARSVYVFDAFGTLFDPASVVRRLEDRYPGEGAGIAASWRATQIRYTWLRSLMDSYVPFDQVTRDALLVAARQAGQDPDPVELGALADGYAELDPYPEAAEVLDVLGRRGVRLGILSNGTDAMLRRLVDRAGLGSRFEAILSVELAGVYKPHPSVYAIATHALDCDPAAIRFVSGNSWDAAGAHRYGFDVVWVDRAGGTPEELGEPADHVVADLHGLLALPP